MPYIYIVGTWVPVVWINLHAQSGDVMMLWCVSILDQEEEGGEQFEK